MCHDLHVANRILEAIKQKNPSFSPKRLLDYGCGTGGALWAAMDKFDEIEAYTGVEQSSALLATAQKLCSGFSLRARWDQQMPKGGDYDLVISVDGLSSMSTKSRRAALEKIWEATDSGMIVVAVHGRRSFNVINQVRDFFISRITRQQKRRERARRDSPESGDHEDGGCGAKDGKNAPAGAIISPCPHMDQCPMQGLKYGCHFGLRMPQLDFPSQSEHAELKTQQRLGRNVIGSYSFVAIDKSASFQEETDDAAEADKEGTASGGEVVSASQLDAQGVRIGGETGGGSNRYTLDVLSHPSKNAKIVASPLKRGGHVVLELCTYEGSYVRATVGKSVGAAYKAAKYKNWGDEWQFQTPTYVERCPSEDLSSGGNNIVLAITLYFIFPIASAPVQPWGAKKKNAKSKDKRRERQQLQQQQQQDQKGLEPETEMRRALMMQSERQSPVSEEAQEGEEEDAYLEMMRELQGIPEDDGDYELAQAVKELETLRRQHKDDDDGADLL
eukprot:jgi/Bigna1/73587/fgenesh1_pg.25_\